MITIHVHRLCFILISLITVSVLAQESKKLILRSDHPAHGNISEIASWPKIPHAVFEMTAGLSCSYAGRSFYRCDIEARYFYLTGRKSKGITVDYHIQYEDLQVGLKYPAYNNIAVLEKIIESKNTTEFIPKSDEVIMDSLRTPAVEKLQEQAERGFALGMEGKLYDNDRNWVQFTRIFIPEGKDYATAVFNSTFADQRPLILKVGDTFQHDHLQYRLTHIEDSDLETKIRPYVILEPVLEDPYHAASADEMVRYNTMFEPAYEKKRNE